MITFLVVYPNGISVCVASEHNSSSGVHSGRAVNETRRARECSMLIINSADHSNREKSRNRR